MERTLRAVFQQHFAGYAEAHGLPLYIHRAAYWLAHCRTIALGGHVKRCPEGHVARAWYNSCHQRRCPQCQAIATERWLEAQKARPLACAHHHLIFTIPHELNVSWSFNCVAMARILFAAVRDTLTELLGDAKYLGARPAFILALHTWGRSLVLHPHIHALVADGGLAKEGAWLRPRTRSTRAASRRGARAAHAAGVSCALSQCRRSHALPAMRPRTHLEPDASLCNRPSEPAALRPPRPMRPVRRGALALHAPNRGARRAHTRFFTDAFLHRSDPAASHLSPPPALGCAHDPLVAAVNASYNPHNHQ